VATPVSSTQETAETETGETDTILAAAASTTSDTGGKGAAEARTASGDNTGDSPASAQQIRPEDRNIEAEIEARILAIRGEAPETSGLLDAALDDQHEEPQVEPVTIAAEEGGGIGQADIVLFAAGFFTLVVLAGLKRFPVKIR
jgi:hypothetical protein